MFSGFAKSEYIDSDGSFLKPLEDVRKESVFFLYPVWRAAQVPNGFRCRLQSEVSARAGRIATKQRSKLVRIDVEALNFRIMGFVTDAWDLPMKMRFGGAI